MLASRMTQNDHIRSVTIANFFFEFTIIWKSDFFLTIQNTNWIVVSGASVSAWLWNGKSNWCPAVWAKDEIITWYNMYSLIYRQKNHLTASSSKIEWALWSDVILYRRAYGCIFTEWIKLQSKCNNLSFSDVLLLHCRNFRRV